MFPFNKTKPAAKDSKGDFVKSLDAAIAAARSNGVSARHIAGQMESRAEAMHTQWVMSAPLDKAW